MSLTIYFSGSISGGRGDVGLYRKLIAALEADGYRVVAGAVAAEHVGDGGEALAMREIFERDLGWIDEANLMVAEVSVPSLGVGYEIAYARYRREIPVICLYRPAWTKRCSAMVAGDPGIEMIDYAENEDVIPRLLESAQRYGRSPVRLP